MLPRLDKDSNLHTSKLQISFHNRENCSKCIYLSTQAKQKGKKSMFFKGLYKTQFVFCFYSKLFCPQINS